VKNRFFSTLRCTPPRCGLQRVAYISSWGCIRVGGCRGLQRVAAEGCRGGCRGSQRVAEGCSRGAAGVQRCDPGLHDATLLPRVSVRVCVVLYKNPLFSITGCLPRVCHTPPRQSSRCGVREHVRGGRERVRGRSVTVSVPRLPYRKKCRVQRVSESRHNSLSLVDTRHVAVRAARRPSGRLPADGTLTAPPRPRRPAPRGSHAAVPRVRALMAELLQPVRFHSEVRPFCHEHRAAPRAQSCP
jgi:hypothetical protein